MLKNHLKIAFRNLRKQAVYSVINIFGLAVGLACCLLILLFVRDEYSYDRFHERADRIYRVVYSVQNNDNVDRGAGSQVPLGPTLAAEFPEVEATARFWRAFQPLIGYNDTRFREKTGFYFTDPAIFEMFSFEWVEGDPETALADPQSVVITESTAKKYFGESDPIGRVLSYDGYPAGETELTVTGVLRDLPHNTHLSFGFLASMVGNRTEFDNWGSTKPIWTYVMLPEHTAPGPLETKLHAFADRYYEGEDAHTLALEPLTDIHLYSQYEGGFKPGSDATYAMLFTAIGFFILLIACINFMNLSTARSLKRAREVGMRKTLGARRGQLVGQFLSEAVLMSAGAMVLALWIVEGILPVFNGFTGKELAIHYFQNPYILPVLVAMVIGVGLLAGSYPAFHLSRFRPILSLKGGSSAGPSGVRIRKGLVVFQFGITIVLMFCTAMVFQQMRYVQNKNLGFDAEQVVVLPYSPAEDVLRQALLQHPNVQAVSVSQRVPVNTESGDGRRLRRPEVAEPIRVESYIVDDRFIDTYKIPLVAGRNLSSLMASDTAAFLINETAVRQLGWSSPEEALDQPLIWSGAKDGIIVGVVQDFHMTSMHEEIEPLVLHMFPKFTYWRTFLSVRIGPGDAVETLDFLATTWQTYTPEGAYSYFFIDQSLQQLHRADLRFGQVFGAFAGLAVFISCLGLFGLVAYTAEQRTKEIGVRKVLGASVAGIVVLLSKDFTRLVVVAIVLGAPVGYLAIHRWLDGFAYHIEISWPVLLFSGLVALLPAFLTVSYQAVKAALTNPVDALRYE